MKTRVYAAVVAASAGRRSARARRIIRSRRSTPTIEKTITGTVNRFEWTNPHTWIWVDVHARTARR